MKNFTAHLSHRTAGRSGAGIGFAALVFPLENHRAAGILVPCRPSPDLILFRLRQDEIGTPQFSFEKLSGRRDLNPGPLVPETSALPSCATARIN